ncbi:glycosyltransferase [Weissella diestrammenae]|uniref:glycosyltransferase n=1 Tax=Weissella diestrammenae TaxID=1162633 RepID=UPI00202E6EAC|nr:glycosyltransferase [Weissella diestrammenae]MCM0583147.1 glycosyltransferase [Weissella diestrammenae]
MTGLIQGISNILDGYTLVYPLIMSIGWAIGAIFFRQHVQNSTDEVTLPSNTINIMISVFNEEAIIDDTLTALYQLSLPNVSFVIVDDFSTDNTVEKIKNFQTEYDWRALTLVEMSQNGGKARALNYALKHVNQAEFVLVIDADSIIDPNAVEYLLAEFDQAQIGAVTGKPVVRNRSTILGTLQSFEYMTTIDGIKRAESYLFESIMSVSGVLVMYRTEALEEIDFFDVNAMTEDIDVTWKLYQHGYSVKYSPNAISYILAPETIKGFLAQRKRWAIGGVEVLLKNLRIIFKHPDTFKTFLLGEMIMGHIWAWSLAFSFVKLIFIYLATGELIAKITVLLIYIILTMVVSLIGLVLDRHASQFTLRDLRVWPVFYVFYWGGNFIASISSEIAIIFGQKGNGTWTSPDRGI